MSKQTYKYNCLCDKCGEVRLLFRVGNWGVKKFICMACFIKEGV